MGVALMVLGGILIVFAFLLAFTVYGVLAALLGLMSLASGAVIIARRAPPT